ncbi:MAG: hypothetical protein KBC64_05080 [Simkaniaceae bacterium]|nr:hypothetical protein [Simkaniaceae bacterium]
MLLEYGAFIVPVVIIMAMWLLIKQGLKIKRRKRVKLHEKGHVHQMELYELKKKMLDLHKSHDKLVENLQSQVHQLKKQLSHLNSSQIFELKEREECIEALKSERALLESEIEGLRASLRALDFRI